MRPRQAGLLLGLALLLSACGNPESDAERSRSAPTAPATVEAQRAITTPSAAVQPKAERTPQSPSKVIRMNEDGSETVEDVSGDSGAHNPLLAAVASTVAAGSSTASAAVTGGTTRWQEGVQYTRLVPTQPTSAPAGQVEVLEFFWYACPHCYAIDPLVETWKKTKPAYVSFSRVHVLWNEGHRSLARLYYTLETLGKLDQLHGEVFKEIHVNANGLIAADPNNAVESERIQTAFVKKFGIPEDAFKAAYHSFAVDTALQKADQLVQRYRVDGVPLFVVNGKFVADVRSAGSPESLLSLVGDLVAQEHKH